jgi:hypothetical protein
MEMPHEVDVLSLLVEQCVMRVCYRNLTVLPYGGSPNDRLVKDFARELA